MPRRKQYKPIRAADMSSASAKHQRTHFGRMNHALDEDPDVKAEAIERMISSKVEMAFRIFRSNDISKD